jgi:hypothetical protein
MAPLPCIWLEPFILYAFLVAGFDKVNHNYYSVDKERYHSTSHIGLAFPVRQTKKACGNQRHYSINLPGYHFGFSSFLLPYLPVLDPTKYPMRRMRLLGIVTTKLNQVSYDFS